jgi:translation initiation factor IF-2
VARCAPGDIVVAGDGLGPCARADQRPGDNVDEAGPFAGRAARHEARREAGDQIVVVESEARAREITEYRQRKLARDKAWRTGSAFGRWNR